MKHVLSSRRSAFTLMELLIVISIIAVLASILLGVTSRVQENANRTTCLNNLHQIGVAALAYESDNNGTLPGPCDPGIKIYYTANTLSSNLAPYIGLPATENKQIVPIFRCPTWKRVAKQPKLFSDNIICYVMDNAISLANGTTIPVSGTPSSDSTPATLPARAAILAGLAGQPLTATGTACGATPTFAMTSTMYITECDQVNWAYDQTPGWYSSLPKKPVHDNLRNTLFFDMHAEARNASLIP